MIHSPPATQHEGRPRIRVPQPPWPLALLLGLLIAAIVLLLPPRGAEAGGVVGDLFNMNPLLGPLRDNGGPTPTQALLPGSPAIDHGDDAGCPTADQRGVPRPRGAACDIGAYEYGGIIYIPQVDR